jgi:hypothetical protein
MGLAEVFGSGGAPLVQVAVIMAVVALVGWVFSTLRRNKAN